MPLFIIRTSPFTSQAFEQCLNIMTETDAMVLIGDGVYVCADATASIQQAPIYALKDDMQARGLSSCNAVTAIDYKDFVELTIGFAPYVNWG